jgi:sirohydrochlorin cobaltochelatase
LKHREAIVLFAHGSREPRWARPFERLASAVGKKTRLPVRLAFLEAMNPSLEKAVAALVKEGARSIRVVPVFLGYGGHLRDDLPKLVNAVGGQHAGLRLTLDRPVGEQAAVIEAIAAAVAGRGN